MKISEFNKIHNDTDSYDSLFRKVHKNPTIKSNPFIMELDINRDKELKFERQVGCVVFLAIVGISGYKIYKYIKKRNKNKKRREYFEDTIYAEYTITDDTDDVKLLEHNEI